MMHAWMADKIHVFKFYIERRLMQYNISMLAHSSILACDMMLFEANMAPPQGRPASRLAALLRQQFQEGNSSPGHGPMPC
jgi:hypothetical protein